MSEAIPNPNAINEEKLLAWFTESPPSAEAIVARQTIRKAATDFARVILRETSPCPDQTIAIRTLREVVMWAQAATL